MKTTEHDKEYSGAEIPTPAKIANILRWCLAHPSQDDPIPLWIDLRVDGSYLLAIRRVLYKE